MEHTAITVPEIGGWATTDDGSAMLLQVLRVNGEEFKLAFPHQLLPTLIEVSARCLAEGATKQGAPENQVHAFRAAQARVQPVVGSTDVMFTVSLAQGAELSFLIGEEMQKALSAGLVRGTEG